MDNNQNLTVQNRQFSGGLLPLKETSEAKKALAVELHDRFHAMRTYGKAPESLESITRIFLRDLGDYSLNDVLKAISTHCSRSQEFFTTSDIIGLIRRNGRPPIKESDVITIRRKEVCDWSHSEAQLVEDWEDEQNESWGDNYRDAEQEERLRDENQRLRQQVHELKSENVRAWDEVKQIRQHKGIEKPSLSQQEKIDRTVAMMKQTGATDDDVDEFLRSAA